MNGFPFIIAKLYAQNFAYIYFKLSNMINRTNEVPNSQRMHNIKVSKRQIMNNLTVRQLNLSQTQIFQASPSLNVSSKNNKSKEQKVKQLIAQKYRSFNRQKLSQYIKDMKNQKINLCINQSESQSKDSNKLQDNNQSIKFQLIPNISVYPFDTGDSWITYNNSIYSFKDNKKNNNFKEPSWMNRMRQIKKSSPEKLKNNQSSQLSDRLILENRTESTKKKKHSLPVFSHTKKKNPFNNTHETKNTKLQAILLNNKEQFSPQSPVSVRRSSMIILDSNVKYKNPERNLSVKFRKTMQNSQNRYPNLDNDEQKNEVFIPDAESLTFIKSMRYNLNNTQLAWFPSPNNPQQADDKFIPILNLSSKLSQDYSQKQTYLQNEIGSHHKGIDVGKIKIQPW